MWSVLVHLYQSKLMGTQIWFPIHDSRFCCIAGWVVSYEDNCNLGSISDMLDVMHHVQMRKSLSVNVAASLGLFWYTLPGFEPSTPGFIWVTLSGFKPLTPGLILFHPIGIQTFNPRIYLVQSTEMWTFNPCVSLVEPYRDFLTTRVSGFHPGGPGSTPAREYISVTIFRESARQTCSYSLSTGQGFILGASHSSHRAKGVEGFRLVTAQELFLKC